MNLSDNTRLLAVKLLHTAVWAFFAACIVAIPVMCWRGELIHASVLCGIVFVEVLVILLNRWTCPLTPVAARYTTDRRANFDIFLPEWLARHNKTIFGALYFASLGVVVYLWLR